MDSCFLLVRDAVGTMVAKDFMTYSQSQQPVANFVNRLMQFIINGKISQRYLFMSYYSIEDAENYIAENPSKFEQITSMNELLKERVRVNLHVCTDSFSHF